MSVLDQLIEAQVDRAVRQRTGRRPLVVFAAYDEDDSPAVLDRVARPFNPEDPPAEGACVLVSDPRPGSVFFGERGRKYRSPVLESPTWLDAAVCADDAIARTGDRHHAHLEGIEFIREAAGVKVYAMWFSS